MARKFKIGDLVVIDDKYNSNYYGQKDLNVYKITLIKVSDSLEKIHIQLWKADSKATHSFEKGYDFGWYQSSLFKLASENIKKHHKLTSIFQ